MSSTPPASEDPRVARSRGRIVAAARACFAERGYRDTSMEDVALRAGVTKRTLYNIYGSKEALFRAAVDATLGIAAAFIRDLVADIDGLTRPELDLPRLAVRLAHDVLDGPVIALRRLVVRESEHFPDLVRRYRAGAPEAVLGALASALEQLAEAGRLRVDDPVLAAEHFAFLVMGAELDRRMLGAPAAPVEHTERAAVAGAHAFLRAYGSASG